jgi:hypothetical protein
MAILGAASTTSWNTDVQAKLNATGAFSSVTTIDLKTTTPTLAQLQGYSAVLVYTDSGVLDGATLGNNLADYVDAGGGVVMAVFAVASVPIGGRFNSQDYYALEPLNQAEPGNLTLGTIHEIGSPLLTGVSSFNGGSSSYYGTGNLNAAAVDVVDWSNGRPLIARRTISGHRRVDLNFYPPSSDARSDFWLAGTDGAKIMANALLYVAGSSVSVPSLSSIALAGLILLLLASGVWMLRPRHN